MTTQQSRSKSQPAFARALLAIVGLFVTGLCTVTPVNAVDLDVSIDFDIPAGSLSEALISFSKQARVQVLVSGEWASAVTTSGIKGKTSIRDALSKLLLNSGLEYRVMSQNAIAVSVKQVGENRATRNGPIAASLVAARADAEKPTDSAANKSALEEIIVSAQRREESLQKAPLALTALTSGELDAMNVSDVADLGTGAVPSLKALPFGGVSNQLALSIRGISSGNIRQTTRDPGVALYIDDVYLARTNGNGMEYVELERIEVLRGPQGTLFGRNAIGGAVRLISKKPTGEFGVRAQMRYGNYDSFRVESHVNLPTVAGLKIKLDGLYDRRDGWVENRANEQRDFDEHENWGARMALRWDAREDVVVDYAFDTASDEVTSTYLTLSEFTNPALSTIWPRALDDGRTDKTWTGLYNPPTKVDSEGHVLSAAWELAEGLTLKGITSYRDLKQRHLNPFVGTSALLPATPARPFALDGLLARSDVDQDQFSAELQLLGKSERLDWIAGVFYFEEDSEEATGSLFSLGLNPQPFIIDPPMALAGSNVDEVKLNHAAAYVQATWTPPVLDNRLEVTSGVRVTHDDKKGQRILRAGLPPTTPLAFDIDSTHVDPMVALSVRLSDQAIAYARYATSYRSGGADSVSPNFTPFDEESLSSFELGLKSEWLQNRLRLNLAGFYSTWEDQAVALQTTAVNVTETFNRDEDIDISGLELDATLVPVEGLTLTGSYQYLHVDNPLVFNPLRNVRERIFLPQAPKHSGALSVDYRFDPIRFGTPRARLDATSSSSYYLTFASPLQSKWTLLNASLALEDIAIGDRGALAVTGWIHNLTDKEYTTFGFNSPIGTVATYYGLPRTYGVKISYEF